MGSIGGQQPDYEVLVIGAGLSGCYACYRMRKLGVKVKVLEAGSSVGGTWYWNRYPGARFDCESYSYGFFFSQELLDEWKWSEHFAPQEETEKYIRFICDKYQLWKDMQFNTSVIKANWESEARCWKLIDQDGHEYTSRFLITGIGLLSNPTLPNIPGVRDFKGQAFHTSRWPKDVANFEGKNVGIIGVGATAIQIIPEIAKTVKNLTVFQRTPNWAIPLHNAKIGEEEWETIRKGYPELLKKIDGTRLSFMHEGINDSIWDATPEEREAFWEYMYAQPGFGFWVSNYKETLVDRKANALVSEFVAKKIRQRVKDPATAEKLIPKTYGFGLRRVPMETFYYEAYNQPNVHLVDLLETPIECITEDGLKTSREDFKLDMIIYATGFSAITGAFDAIDFRGIDNHALLDEWKEGPRTYLGLTVQHFPNMFMSIGPHQAYGNIPRSIEYAVGWISDCIEYLRNHDITYIEAKEQGIVEWTNHVHDLGQGLLSNEVDSWLTGVNKNLAGKQKRIIARYSGSAVDFRKSCNAVASTHYDTFKLL
ncbi:FAD/NAD(P)-binding domain-containing protein [Mollisia scopiformis]|uniref:FAD/NAD(P)-binding domain-containing protein n=1 Tax=Mollisia scopiformis TaxID=149040 RepID=A0A194XMY1_MOLSC|nr:FAD/NAD(P)-binding domain-containing protein [Mollisia scopiformis]KUJ21444.1 FAD/NAD(P)-binding domain-containing protein [Mollisia scopiformis]